MSKRCCAKKCYNSQMTNIEVHYFGFPKSEYYSQKWALAAGREDLLNKPLHNIIKYFLCSSHFTDDCFADPPKNSKLIKTLRPLTVPLPTVFESNIDLYLPKHTSTSCKNATEVQKELHKTNANDDVWENVDYILESDNNEMTNSNNLILYEKVYLQDNNLKNRKKYYLKTNEEYNVDQSNTSQEDNQNDLLQPEVEDHCLNNFYSCRLCANDYALESLLFFQEHDEIVETINYIMPNMKITRDDCLPQQICIFCLEKVNSCKDIIFSFEKAQEKLVGNC